MPRRAWMPAPSKPHFEDVLGTAEDFVVSTRRTIARLARQGRSELTGLARHVTPAVLGPRLRRLRADARAIAVPYSHDERQALALLFLPFLLVASAIVVHQSVRTLQSYLAAVAIPDQEVASLRPGTTPDLPLVAAPQNVAREAVPARTALTAGHPTAEAHAVDGARSALEPSLEMAIAQPAPAPNPMLSSDTGTTALAPASGASLPATPAESELALLAPVGDLRRAVQPLAPDALDAFDADENGKPMRPGICAIDDVRRTAQLASFAASKGAPLGLDAEAFGLRLARAAESQVGSFVIYNDNYQSISYPMGDVNNLFGVCTDVIVRAYRALGLDLQALVHQTRSGRGDRSIDHRRAEILRRFFAREGENLPVTTFPEDYRPGDIVTYYRPQTRGTHAHIAIVSSVIAPSGRPMIVHNRGWGPQLEDALFIDEITGHYRFRGPATARNAAHEDAGNSPLTDPDAAVRPASFPAAGHAAREARN